jgi:methionyl-tRNA formyltransferase
MTKICFLGNNTAYSNQVKTALEAAGYELADDGPIISAAYGSKLPPGGLNLHPSLLPAYRGATPVPHQLLDGIKISGITIIQMADKVDAGPIVAQEIVPVRPDDTSLDLLNRCFAAGAKLLIKVLPDYLNNKITLKPQPAKSPTPYCRRFTKQDGFVSWDEFKCGIDERRIRALHPWPGVWTKLPNGKILKLLPKNLYQIEGKQPITQKQFIAGYKNLF